MARPSKGPRLAFTMRLPIALAERIEKLNLRDRHGWIVDAIGAKLNQEENAHGGQVEEAPG